MSTPRHLAECLEAEYVIQHRAGGHVANAECVADFIAQQMPYRLPKNAAKDERLFWLVAKLGRLVARLEQQNERSHAAAEISSLLVQVQSDSLTR